MKKMMLLIFCAAVSGPIFAAVKIQNVKVVVTEKGEDPVTVTVPYWVAKSTAQVSELVDLGNEHVPVQKVLKAIENAPRLGMIMTIEKKDQKIVISIE